VQAVQTRSRPGFTSSGPLDVTGIVESHYQKHEPVAIVLGISTWRAGESGLRLCQPLVGLVPKLGPDMAPAISSKAESSTGLA
jgi:hypothetical protein